MCWSSRILSQDAFQEARFYDWRRLLGKCGRQDTTLYQNIWIRPSHWGNNSGTFRFAEELNSSSKEFHSTFHNMALISGRASWVFWHWKFSGWSGDCICEQLSLPHCPSTNHQGKSPSESFPSGEDQHICDNKRSSDAQNTSFFMWSCNVLSTWPFHRHWNRRLKIPPHKIQLLSSPQTLAITLVRNPPQRPGTATQKSGKT